MSELEMCKHMAVSFRGDDRNCHFCLRDQVDSLHAQLEAKDKEIERLAWNLAGCLTYAEGNNLQGGHSKELETPALRAVLKLANQVSDLAALEGPEVKSLVEAFHKTIESVQNGWLDSEWSIEEAIEALAQYRQATKGEVEL